MINEIIQQAFLAAKSTSTKKNNSSRSKVWVQELAARLRGKYESPSYRVFSSDCYENRECFRINELLYDISVVKMATVESASGKINLEYIHSSEWIIESEFHASDSRESIIDISKLFMGQSINKLIVLPKSTSIAEWALTVLVDVIPSDCNFYLALVPHPSEWYSSDELPEVYCLEKSQWAKLEN